MFKALKRLFGRGDTKTIILRNVQANNGIVYGATAAQMRMGGFARSTTDVDAFMPNPKTNAMQTEKQLDTNYGSDQFYVKGAKHKGTWKIKDKGFDGKKGTEDDKTVADYSPYPKPLPPHSKIGGLNVVNLSHVKKTKQRTLGKKKYVYRSEKDSEDVARINFFNKRI